MMAIGRPSWSLLRHPIGSSLATLSLISLTISQYISVSASTELDIGKQDEAARDANASLVHYLLPSATYQKLKADSRNDDVSRALLELLEQVGPDMRPANGFMDPPNVTLELAKRAWLRMREHAQGIARHRLDFAWPLVRQALVQANVSAACHGAAEEIVRGARRLETWAVKMLNSWGTFPPGGIFEGTLGDIGSYHSCLDVRPPASGPRHAHYCSLSYRPVLPTRPDYELIISQEPRELLELFGAQDAFSQLAKKSQYNHYVYLKFGTCLPIECSPVDAQKLAKLLGRRGVLMSGPVKCHSLHADDYAEEGQVQGERGGIKRKLALSTRDLNGGIYIWKPHVSGTQLVALACLGSLLCLVLAFTLADLILNRAPKMLSDLSVTREQQDKAPDGARDDDDDDELALEPLTVMNHVIVSPDVCAETGAPGEQPADLNNNTRRESDASKVKAALAELDERQQLETISNYGAPGPGAGQRVVRAEEVPLKQHQQQVPHESRSGRPSGSLLAELVADFSVITNTAEFFAVSKHQLASDILCMNGLRCITMSWIILAHTVQYNDWAAFARIYEVEAQLNSLANQPIFNASYLVDTFFLMSGLLTSFSVFRCKKKKKRRRSSHRPGGDQQAPEVDAQRHFSEILESFSWRSYLVGRYLRLTPQILLVSLLFICLPLLSAKGGPHWHSMTGEYAENCANNWWVNLLHAQAFYKPDEMCNYVCWWISVDMAYHLLALAVILVVLRLGARSLGQLCAGLALVNALFQAARHHQMALPPNMLSTIPQTGAMWSQMTLRYFWTPNAHLFPFVFGLAFGYCLARHKGAIARWFTRRRALAGWLLALGLFGLVLFGTRRWIVGEARYSRASSAAFALLAQVAWSAALAWTIVACQLGYGSFIDRALSCRLFIVLGKASYLVYLSHFLVLFAFFGSQNLLLEPTRIMIVYIILANICVSMLLGCVLCVAFEMPWLKIQRRIMRHIK